MGRMRKADTGRRSAERREVLSFKVSVFRIRLVPEFLSSNFSRFREVLPFRVYWRDSRATSECRFNPVGVVDVWHRFRRSRQAFSPRRGEDDLMTVAERGVGVLFAAPIGRGDTMAVHFVQFDLAGGESAGGFHGIGGVDGHRDHRFREGDFLKQMQVLPILARAPERAIQFAGEEIPGSRFDYERIGGDTPNFFLVVPAGQEVFHAGEVEDRVQFLIGGKNPELAELAPVGGAESVRMQGEPQVFPKAVGAFGILVGRHVVEFQAPFLGVSRWRLRGEPDEKSAVGADQFISVGTDAKHGAKNRGWEAFWQSGFAATGGRSFVAKANPSGLRCFALFSQGSRCASILA